MIGYIVLPEIHRNMSRLPFEKTLNLGYTSPVPHVPGIISRFCLTISEIKTNILTIFSTSVVFL